MRNWYWVVVVALLGMAVTLHAQSTISSTQSSRSTTPIYELLKYRPNYDTHLSDLNSDLVLVQVRAFNSEERAVAFLNAHLQLDLIGIKLEREDEQFDYLILLGAYDDFDSARWAIEDFRELNPSFKGDQIERIRLGEIQERIVRIPVRGSEI